MSHADETVTDPHVYRLRTSRAGRGAVFAWDYPGATLLRVRITRSSVAPDAGRAHSEVVYDGYGGSFRDSGVPTGRDAADRAATAARDAGGSVAMTGAGPRAGSIVPAPTYRVEATLDGEDWATWHDGPL